MDVNAATGTISMLQGNITILIIGVILILATIVLLALLKRIIVNSILGIAAWLIVNFIFPLFGLKISIPFWPSLIASVIFGLAGIGTVLVLAFLGFL